MMMINDTTEALFESACRYTIFDLKRCKNYIEAYISVPGALHVVRLPSITVTNPDAKIFGPL